MREIARTTACIAALVAVAGCASDIPGILDVDFGTSSTTAAGMSTGSSTTGAPGSSTGSGTAGEAGSDSGAMTSAGSTSGASASTSTGDSSSSTGSPPVCGDGVVDAGEECDDGNQDDEDGCASCFRDRLVFVTSMMFRPSHIHGVAGGDNLCAQLANQAGLGLNWKGYGAWLSDTTSSAGERLFAGGGYYRRVDGVAVAHDFAQFLSGELLAPINVDEFGKPQIGGAWTGTRPDGTAAPDVTHCDDWSTESFLEIEGYYGSMGSTDEAWTLNPTPGVNPTTCGDQLHLYCLEGP